MKERLLNQLNSISNSTKVMAIGVGTATTTLLSSIPVHAAGLDATVETAITTGFTDAGSAIATIVGLGVTATIGIIAMSGGAKAGLKWVKGIFAKAS